MTDETKGPIDRRLIGDLYDQTRPSIWVPWNALLLDERNAYDQFVAGITHGLVPAASLTAAQTELEKARAEVAMYESAFRREAALTARLIREGEEAREELRALNDAAADLVAEAVGPYDPPQLGSNLEKLYRLVSRPKAPPADSEWYDTNKRYFEERNHYRASLTAAQAELEKARAEIGELKAQWAQAMAEVDDEHCNGDGSTEVQLARSNAMMRVYRKMEKMRPNWRDEAEAMNETVTMLRSEFDASVAKDLAAYNTVCQERDAAESRATTAEAALKAAEEELENLTEHWKKEGAELKIRVMSAEQRAERAELDKSAVIEVHQAQREKLQAAERDAGRMHYLGNLVRSRTLEEQAELNALMRAYPARPEPASQQPEPTAAEHHVAICTRGCCCLACKQHCDCGAARGEHHHVACNLRKPCENVATPQPSAADSSEGAGGYPYCEERGLCGDALCGAWPGSCAHRGCPKCGAAAGQPCERLPPPAEPSRSHKTEETGAEFRYSEDCPGCSEDGACVLDSKPCDECCWCKRDLRAPAATPPAEPTQPNKLSPSPGTTSMNASLGVTVAPKPSPGDAAETTDDLKEAKAFINMAIGEPHGPDVDALVDALLSVIRHLESRPTVAQAEKARGDGKG